MVASDLVDDVEVMPGLGCRPLGRRHSASEQRWSGRCAHCAEAREAINLLSGKCPNYSQNEPEVLLWASRYVAVPCPAARSRVKSPSVLNRIVH